jgi:formiminoglutamase
MIADAPPVAWTGRDDGPGTGGPVAGGHVAGGHVAGGHVAGGHVADGLRWHHVVSLDEAGPGDAAVVGFRSDEGVRRNKGRAGAVDGPSALRAALASMALPGPLRLLDVGDIVVEDGNLEDAQQRLGKVVTDLVDGGHPALVLGGGHEVAYGSYLGLAGRSMAGRGRVGVLNLDAHFDLRDDARASSGTPFLQMARDEARCGRRLNYWVLGISQPSNTQRLFRAAADLGVRYLSDTECGLLNLARVDRFVHDFLASCDVVHLSIDLDVLPSDTAPGVSAPAAYGVRMEIVEHVCATVAASGKLAVCDVAELNPALDVDARTARAGARLLHRILTTAEPRFVRRAESGGP